MAKNTKIYSTNDPIKFTLVSNTSLGLLLSWWSNKGVQPAFLKDGSLSVINSGLSGNLTPMCLCGDYIVCQYSEPRKAASGVLLSLDGKTVKQLEMPKLKGSNVFPFWSDGVNVGGKLMCTVDKVTVSKSAVWDKDGKLLFVSDSEIVGKVGNNFVYSDQAFNCPDEFSSPVARGVREFNSFGYMFVDGKKATGNSCSWIKDEIIGDLVYLVPSVDLGVNRFSILNISNDGRFGVGYGFNSVWNPDLGAKNQINLLFDRENGFVDMDSVLGVVVNPAKTIFDGDVIYSIGSDGIYKIENWF